MWVLIQDLRYGLRMLARNPGFAAVAVIALALGIGANTAIFSVVNGVLLQPLPYSDPDRLMRLSETSPDFGTMSVACPNFVDWKDQNRSFAGLAAVRWEDYDVTGGGQPEHLSGKMVSADFFRVLGISPVLGRDFDPGADRLGAAPVVLISGGLWSRRFGSSPAVLGSQIRLNGRSYTIAGVVPAGFQFEGKADVYTLLEQWDDILARSREMHPGMYVVGRLKPGVTQSQAQSEMTRHRGPPGRGLSEIEFQARRQDRAAHGRDRRQRPPHPAGSARRGGLRAPHRLRQRGQPAAGALHQAPEGDCHPHRDGRRPRPRGPATADRERGAGARRGHRRAGHRPLGHASGAGGRAGRPAAHGEHRCRRLGARLHAGRLAPHRHRLRAGSGPAGLRHRPARDAERRQPRLLGRAPAPAQPAGDLRSGRRAGAAGRSRPDAAHHLEPRPRQSGIRPRPPPDLLRGPVPGQHEQQRPHPPDLRADRRAHPECARSEERRGVHVDSAWSATTTKSPST